MENLILRYENDVLTAKLAGELDHHLAAEIRTKIDEEMMAKLPKKLQRTTQSNYIQKMGTGNRPFLCPTKKTASSWRGTGNGIVLG